MKIKIYDAVFEDLTEEETEFFGIMLTDAVLHCTMRKIDIMAPLPDNTTSIDYHERKRMLEYHDEKIEMYKKIQQKLKFVTKAKLSTGQK